MFKVKHKDTRTYIKPFSSVSIVNFEQVIASGVYVNILTKNVSLLLMIYEALRTRIIIIDDFFLIEFCHSVIIILFSNSINIETR